MIDYDFGSDERIDRILALVRDGWRQHRGYRLGQFLDIVAETHELGVVPDWELERRLRDPSTWGGPPARGPDARASS